MRYVAAYLLATLGGKANPSRDDIIQILESVGLEIDEERLDKVMSELEGKNISDVIAEGMGKLASIPSGGVVAASAGGGASTEAGEKAEEKKEEAEQKKEESEGSSDEDMGFGLFD